MLEKISKFIYSNNNIRNDNTKSDDDFIIVDNILNIDEDDIIYREDTIDLKINNSVFVDSIWNEFIVTKGEEIESDDEEFDDEEVNKILINEDVVNSTMDISFLGKCIHYNYNWYNGKYVIINNYF